MDYNECIWILRNLAYTDKNLWEAARLKIFSTVSMFSKGGLKLQDIIKFPWEGDMKEEPEEPHMSEEQRKEMEHSILEMLNGKKE